MYDRASRSEAIVREKRRQVAIVIVGFMADVATVRSSGADNATFVHAHQFCTVTVYSLRKIYPCRKKHIIEGDITTITSGSKRSSSSSSNGGGIPPNADSIR